MKEKILEFLYKQVQENKIPQIRKGMVEDIEGFVEGIIAEREAARMAHRVQTEQQKVAQKEEESDEADLDPGHRS